MPSRWCIGCLHCLGRLQVIERLRSLQRQIRRQYM
jgi:hypothetical protein